MPLLRYNVKSANFPLLSSFLGASISVRSNGDTDYVITDAYTGTQANNEIGIAQPIYLHNVMPSNYGFQSIGYKHVIANYIAPSSNFTMFDQAIILRSADEERYLLSPAQGTNYILGSRNRSVWAKATQNTLRLGGTVTKSYINARTIIAYANHTWLEYKSQSNTIDTVTPVGLEPAAIKGIVNANNYNIAYNSTTVYWSSVGDPLDFVPSLLTGAGSANPQSVRGAIVACLPIADGFVIYTTHNAVAAIWSGNSNAPWVFREIPGAAGIVTPEHVSSDSNYSTHFAWTTSGLQQIDKREGINIFPEVTDFLAKKQIEEWSAEAKTIEPTVQLHQPHSCLALVTKNLLSPVKLKLNYIGTRFLAISYGEYTGQYQYILVYDSGLKRWGKLKIAHADCFEYSPPGREQPVPLESFGVLDAFGNIFTIDFSELRQSLDSVFIFGGIALTRDSYTRVSAISLDTTSTNSYRAKLYSAVSGRNLSKGYALPENTIEPLGVKWKTSIVGTTHALELVGTFNLVSLLFELDRYGKL